MRSILLPLFLALTGCLVAQSNDFTGSAINLHSSSPATMPFVSEGATRDSSEPIHDGNATSGSRWWTWTAPRDGNLTLSATNSGTIVLFGDLFFQDPIAKDPVLQTFPVRVNEQYYIGCVGTSNFTGTLTFQQTPPPVNDDFTNATLLEGMAIESSFSLLGSSVELDEANSGKSIWFKWIPPTAGLFSLNGEVANDALSTLIKFRTFSGTSYEDLTELGETDAGANSLIAHAVDPGQAIMIQVIAPSGFHDLDEGSISLNFNETFEHDSRFAPINLGSEASVDLVGDNTGASSNPTDWGGINQFISGNIWYQWTAPFDGILYLYADSETTLYDPYLSLHASSGGLDDDRLAILARNSSSPSAQRVESGKTYHLSYSTDDNSRSGPSQIALRLIPINPQYQRTQASPLPSTDSILISSSFEGALADESTSHGSSLWYSWNAPQSGAYLIYTPEETSDLAIWRELPDGELVLLAQNQRTKIAFTADQGETYLISALGSSFSRASFQWQMKAITAPSNDLFANRSFLTQSENWSIIAHNYLAGAEPNEPNHSNGAASNSIWFSWTAPSTGDFLLDVPYSDFQLAFAIYTGSELTNLVSVGRGEERLIFTAQQNQTYQIAIDSRLDRIGEFTLTCEPAIRPENDDFANRLLLTGGRPIVSGDLRYATAEQGETIGIFEPSLWFEWTPSFTDSLIYPRSELSVYTADSAESTLADLILETPSSSGTLLVSPGKTYYLQLSGNGRAGSSSKSIDTANSLNYYLDGGVPRPSNETFANRIILPSLTSIRTGTEGLNAERQGLGPDVIAQSRVAWWSWTAPMSGPYQITSQNPSAVDVCIYQGENVEELVEIACAGLHGAVLNAVAGETYHIAPIRSNSNVGFLSERESRYWLGFDIRKLDSSPENDSFSNPINLPSSLSFRSPQNNYLATIEAGEPTPTGVTPNHSVWSTWTPPVSGTVNLTTEEDTTITLYSGTELTGLTQVSSGTASITGQLIAGQTYFISVDSTSELQFTLNGEISHPPFTNDHFAQAEVWTGSSHFTFGNADAHTIETNEPLPSRATSAQGSSWWRWTAPETGPVLITTQGESFIKTLYEGESLANLQQLATYTSSSAPLVFHALAGTTYSIQIINRFTGRSGDFTLSLEQTTEAPAGDLFAHAVTISGDPISIVIDTEGASYEAGEPESYNRSTWYQWIAPENGLYTFSSSSRSFRLYRGGTLTSLETAASITREAVLNVGTGEKIQIAFSSSSSTKTAFTILKSPFDDTDDFVNRLDLGSALQISQDIDTTDSTLEPDEVTYPGSRQPIGSNWLEWTAPISGLTSLSLESHIFTGDSLGTLTALDLSGTSRRFIAVKGTTYQFSLPRTTSSSAEKTFQLTTASLPNDDLENRQTIAPELPFRWSGPVPNATFQPFEHQASNGSIWFEWTAPRSGRILLRGGSNDGFIYRAGPSIPEIALLSSQTDNTQTVYEGETFFIQILGDSFSDSEFSIHWIDPSITNFTFDTALPINTIETTITVAREREGSLSYYQWLADKTGTLTITVPNNPVVNSSLFILNESSSYEMVSPQNAQRNSYAVIEGTQYWIRISDSSSASFQWSTNYGPLGDQFADATTLTDQPTILWQGDTTGAGWEEGEPIIEDNPADQTVWRKWTPLTSGLYRFSTSNHTAAICQGTQVDALTVLAEGISETFHAVAGETYHIVVNSITSNGPFELTLSRVNSSFEIWRESHFSSSSRDGIPSSDPDGDGRENLLEMALGSNPNQFDGDIEMWIEEDEESLFLSVRRPAEITGVTYSFEVTGNLSEWQSTSNLPHQSELTELGDGHEILTMSISKDLVVAEEKLFTRLRVVLDPGSN